MHLLIISFNPISWLPYYSHCIALLYFEFINNKEACLIFRKKIKISYDLLAVMNLFLLEWLFLGVTQAVK